MDDRGGAADSMTGLGLFAKLGVKTYERFMSSAPPSPEEKNGFLKLAREAFPAQNFKRPAAGCMSLVAIGEDVILKSYPRDPAKTQLEAILMDTFAKAPSEGSLKSPSLLDGFSLPGALAMSKARGQSLMEIWPDGKMPEPEQERLGQAIGRFTYEFDKAIRANPQVLSLVPQGGSEGLDALSRPVRKQMKRIALSLPEPANETALAFADHAQSALFDARKSQEGITRVFHGDLNTSNILAEKQGDGSYAYSVIDFGEAKKQNPADGLAKMFASLWLEAPRIMETAVQTINQLAARDGRPAWGDPHALRIAGQAAFLAHRSKALDPELAAAQPKEAQERIASDYAETLLNFSRGAKPEISAPNLAQRLSFARSRQRAAEPAPAKPLAPAP